MGILISGTTGIDAGNLPVTNTGNVGVGTSSPTFNLDIINTQTTGTSADNAITRVKSTNRNSYLLLDTIGGSYSGIISNYANGTNVSQLNFDANGNIVSILPNGGIGYGTGSGGTVTQITSKSASVTLNKPTGMITMHNAALAAGAVVTFQFNNSLMVSGDGLLFTFNPDVSDVQINYSISSWSYNGYAYISIKNQTTSTLSQPISFKFQLIKGALA